MKKIFIIFIILIFTQCAYADYPPTNNTSRVNNVVIQNNSPLLIAARKNYQSFRNEQQKYEFNSLYMNTQEKEKAFLQLTEYYINGIDELNDYLYNLYENEKYILPDNYVVEYKNMYKQLGVSFIFGEGEYYFICDYTNLLNTTNIPQRFKKYLQLQQECMLMAQNQSKHDGGFEILALNADELEKFIIQFENIEKKSPVIASIDNNHLYNSKWMLMSYLTGVIYTANFDPDNDDILYDSFKISYEHFLKKHKSSKYYPLVKEYYAKVERDNFKFSEKTRDWATNEIEKISKIEQEPEVDFNPYMRELQSKIKDYWHPPKENISRKVVLLFKIDKNGHLLSCRVYRSSGNPSEDQAAIRAVKSAAPFAPLPKEFKGDNIEIHFSFNYNVF